MPWKAATTEALSCIVVLENDVLHSESAGCGVTSDKVVGSLDCPWSTGVVVH